MSKLFIKYLCCTVQIVFFMFYYDLVVNACRKENMPGHDKRRVAQCRKAHVPFIDITVLLFYYSVIFSTGTDERHFSVNENSVVHIFYNNVFLICLYERDM